MTEESEREEENQGTRSPRSQDKKVFQLEWSTVSNVSCRSSKMKAETDP